MGSFIGWILIRCLRARGRSNWAMPHGAAARYNGGVHVAQGLTNQDFAAKFATTKYSILGADYRL